MSKMMTRRNQYDLFDPFFDDFFDNRSTSNSVMKTDIKDLEDHYEVKVEVPEIKKEDIKLHLDDGYLTINATLNSNNDVKEHGKFVRKERYYGSFQRSFFVGENVKEEDVKASLNDGVLTLNINKVAPKEETRKYIAIE